MTQKFNSAEIYTEQSNSLKNHFWCLIFIKYFTLKSRDPISHMHPLRPIWADLHPTFKILCSTFVDHLEVPLQFQMKLIDLQYSEYLKSKFFYLPHPWFLWEPYSSIWMIPRPYHPHPANNEHICLYLIQWTVVHQNNVCQEYTAFATVKLSLVWWVPSVNLFI